MTTTKIPAELVAVNAIQGTLIADNAITAVHIATNAISGTLIADNAITSTHIAENSVTATQIAMNTITVTQVADNAITTPKIIADAVTGAKIANDSIDSEHLVDGSIDTAHIGDVQVTAAKLGDNAVTLAKMASLARGSVIVGDAAGDPAALAIGSNTYVLSSDGTDIAWAANDGITTINNNADNRVITGSGTANTLNGESNFVYDGTNVGIGTSSPQKLLDITDSSSGESIPVVISNKDVTAGTGQKVTLGFGLSRNSGTFKPEAGTIEVGRESDWTVSDTDIDSYMAFSTYLNNAATEKMRIDSLGHVGIGVSPYPWGADYDVIDLNTGGAIYGTTTGLSLSANLYFTGSAWLTKTTGPGTLYATHSGKHFWYNSASAAAGTGAALTERMSLDTAGNLYCSGGSGGTILTLTASSGTTSGDIGRIRFGNNDIDSNLANIVGYQDGATDSGGLKFETQPTGGATVERMRIDSSGKIQIGNNIPMWSGSYGGALFLKGNNATADRYAQLTIVDSTGSIANQGLIVNNSGNVGIGTTNPAQPLHVLSSTALIAGVARFQYSGGNDYEVIRVESLGNSDAHIGFFADGDTNYYGGFGIDYSDAGKFKLQTDNLFAGGSNLMTWARDGNVGIGTTNPSETLHLNAGGSGPELRFQNASGSHYIRAYNDNWNFLANSTNTAMTIRNSGQVEFGGNVGIGTASPVAPLMVQGDGASGQFTALALRHDDSDGDNNTSMTCDIDFYLWDSNTRNSTPQGRIGLSSIDLGAQTTESSGTLSFYTTDAVYPSPTLSERLRISNTGQLMVANYTGSHSAIGHVFHANGTYTQIHTTVNNESSIINNYQGSGTDKVFDFRWDNASKGSIALTSTAVAFNTSSDYRLKENVDYTWDATTRLKQLKPARFNWIADDTNTLVDGFLAHEVSSVVHNAVTGTKDEVYAVGHDLEGDDLYQSVDHSKLVPLLVKTIQELEARLTAGGL